MEHGFTPVSAGAGAPPGDGARRGSDSEDAGDNVIDRLVEPHQVNYRTAGLDHLDKGIIRTLLFIASP